MKQGQQITFQKLAAAPNALVPTPEFDAYKQGQDNGQVSLPVDYTLKGSLIDDVIVGKSVRILRTERNGVKAAGLTTTTPVKKIVGNKIHTSNSVYLMTVE